MILQMDWVERRANNEKMFRSQLPIAWEHLCGAMKRAIESYMSLFTETGADADLARRYTNEATVTLKATDHSAKFCQARIQLNMKTGELIVEYPRRNAQTDGQHLTSRFHVNEGVTFYLGEKRLTFDEASEAIIGRVLFPTPDQWV